MARPSRVEAGEEDWPTAVCLPAGRRDEWWRERPVSRVYYSLLLEDGGTVTAYRDLVSGRWAKKEIS